MSELRPSTDPTQDELLPLMADRLTAVIESRMSNDLAWLQDDGKTVIRLSPEEAGWHIAWLYKIGDVVSGLPPLAIEAEAGAERDRLEAALRAMIAHDAEQFDTAETGVRTHASSVNGLVPPSVALRGHPPMADVLERLSAHMAEYHNAAVAGFTVYELMGEHGLLHQYEHGIPDEGTPHDLAHHSIVSESGSEGTPD